MPRKILVALDMSPMSKPLASYALSLAFRLDTETTFIHVLPHTYLWRGYDNWLPRNLDREVHEVARKRISYFLKKAEENNPHLADVKREIIVEEGNPADIVIETAREGQFNLILIGHRGHSTIERLVVGSTATSIARYAHCSILLYRPGLEEVL